MGETIHRVDIDRLTIVQLALQDSISEDKLLTEYGRGYLDGLCSPFRLVKALPKETVTNG